MNTMASQTQASSGGGASKSLWAAVGALSVVVIALGATLVHLQTRPVEPRTAVLAAAAPAAADAPADKKVEPAATKDAAPVKSAPVASKSGAHRTEKPPKTVQVADGPVLHSGVAPASVADSQPSQPIAPAIAKPLCINCGTVIAVTPVQREAAGSGVGVVAGGVLGALVGNQVGNGNGRAAATILGALGGGWAGNTVEKKMKKEMVYQIQLRMDDGHTRIFEQMTPVAVGEKVTIEGSALRLPDGSLTTPVPVPPAQPATYPAPNAG